MASYNKDSGEIYSIMYLIDKNNNHNPEKYRYKPLNETPFMDEIKKLALVLNSKHQQILQ